MNKNDIEHQLKVNKHRMDITDALLRLHSKSDLLITITKLSSDPKAEIMNRFGLNDIQASALLDLRKTLSEISITSIQAEMERLKSVENELK
jgi:DNA gyrase/topoisomerase IV subunit A